MQYLLTAETCVTQFHYTGVAQCLVGKNTCSLTPQAIQCNFSACQRIPEWIHYQIQLYIFDLVLQDEEVGLLLMGILQLPSIVYNINMKSKKHLYVPTYYTGTYTHLTITL